jgi:Tn3 transposase DDE domain
VSRTCLREETIRRANAALVNYHRALPLSRCWGEGQIASSDGQRFGVRESLLLAAFYGLPTAFPKKMDMRSAHAESLLKETGL